MPDENTVALQVALQEIAGLLKRRVEQHDEHHPPREPVEQIRAKGELRSAELMKKMEINPEQIKQERAEIQQDQRQFQENLLVELKRPNDLMEQLLSRLV